jgi:coenzyme F420-0:L-glutamate ligase / coenzyme F420-1:gamma-L-glutamate ligase
MCTNDSLAFLRSRRSIRRFKPDPVPDPVIRKLIETATYAPSAHNRQPWRFVVVGSPEARARLGDAIADRFAHDMAADGEPREKIDERTARTRRRIAEAPAVIVLCRDADAVDPQPDAIRQQAEAAMGRQSVALAGLQLLLAAHARGLAGTWVCWPLFAPQEISAALELPATWEPQAMVFLGHPDEQPKPKDLKELDEIVRFE